MSSHLTDPTSTAILASTVHLDRCHLMRGHRRRNAGLARRATEFMLTWRGQLHVAHLLRSLKKTYKQANKWETVHSSVHLLFTFSLGKYSTLCTQPWCTALNKRHTWTIPTKMQWVHWYSDNDIYSSTRKAFTDKWFPGKVLGYSCAVASKPSFGTMLEKNLICLSNSKMYLLMCTSTVLLWEKLIHSTAHLQGPSWRSWAVNGMSIAAMNPLWSDIHQLGETVSLIYCCYMHNKNGRAYWGAR